MALHLGAVPDAMAVVLERVRRRPRARRRDRAQRPLWRRHAPARHLHVPPIFAGERAAGLRRGHRAPLRHGRPRAGLERQRTPPRSSRKACASRRSSSTTRGVPNRTLLALIAQNVRLPELVLGDLDAQFATCAHRRARAPRACSSATATTTRSLLRPAARLRRGADPQGDRRLARRRPTASPTTSTATAFRPTPIPIACRHHRRRRPARRRLRRLLAAGEGRDQLAPSPSSSPRPTSPSAARSTATSRTMPASTAASTVTRARGLDPQPAHARPGRGARADRLPRGRHGPGRARPDRAGAADGGGRRRQHGGRHRRLPGAAGPSSWST